VVFLGEGGYTYILWDLQQKKEITRLLHWNISGPEIPRWSPDGSRFVMSAYFGDMSLWPQPADGVYVVDAEAKIEKLMSTGANVFILDHFWSPSGRYIALLQNIPNSEIQEKKLLVLDTQTSKIVDTCVQYRSWTMNDTPIWSPDETQILLYDNTQEHSEVRLVDLMKRVAFPVAEEMEPRGWMKLP